MNEIERLKAEIAAMREALELFQAAEDHRISHRCIIRTCDTWFNLENRACLAAIDALAADAGRALLERLRRAEHERDEWKRKWEAAIVQFAEESR